MKRKRIVISTISIIILFTFISIVILIRNRSLANDILFTSKNYNIQENIITNISPNTSIELFKKYFDTSNCSISITNENDETLTNGFIYTGSKTNVYDLSHNLIGSYTNIITGDINYDGLVDINDINALATYLVKENNLDDYQKKAIDINKDNQVKINDLTLLETFLDASYESISFSKEEITLMSNEQERLVPTITPNIVLNQNLTWTTSNEDVAEVDESGKVIPNNEGESIITATTKDGSVSASIKIKVDNTPQLSESSVRIYTGTKKTTIGIKAIDYPSLTCQSSNPNAATCEIENNELILTPVNQANTTITVTSPYYGSVELSVSVKEVVNFHVQPLNRCVGPNKRDDQGIVTGFYFGAVSLVSISDEEIVKEAIVYPNNITIVTGSKYGKADVVLTEDHGNNTTTTYIYVYKLQLSQTAGITPVGTNLNVDIDAETTGNLSCASSDETKATCTIENNKLIITPVSAGNATITVNGQQCGTATYTVTVTGETETPESNPEANPESNPAPNTEPEEGGET